MCTLAVYVRCATALPLLVAANRDEFLDRPTADPRQLAADPWVVGGQDLSAGGTWFGVNGAGMVVGLLNRRRPGGPDQRLQSRGLLTLTMLQQPGLDAARRALEGEDGAAYNAFNLLIADRTETLVVTNRGGAIQIAALDPGVHLLTNLELNDPTCPRIAKSWEHFRALDLAGTADPADLVPRLRIILADHSTALDPRAEVIDTLCVHLPGYGTRSSSIVAADPAGRLRYWHAPGPPCRTDYSEVQLPGSAA
ncbi:MAG TPA: NRDE family protein [Candidatus Dormibacteraeota bacterium]|nr:NRDE family protein [Candidatus Dormibacteraeota bacterium]